MEALVRAMVERRNRADGRAEQLASVYRFLQGSRIPRHQAGRRAEAGQVMKPLGHKGFRTRAGDRGRTGDVQLGKLAFYR